MTTYYVDTTAGAGGSGGSWATAWNNLQDAIDGTNGTAPVAGDVVLCYSNGNTSPDTGTYCTFDVNGGDATSGYIKYVGCSTNSGDGSPDGTKYVLDGNGTLSPIAALWSDRIWIENFRFTNAAGDGVNSGGGSTPDQWVWINCEFDNNGDDGFSDSTSTQDYTIFIGCRFHDNTGDGLDCPNDAKVINCAAYSNGAYGIFSGGARLRLIRSAVFDNGDGYPNVYLSTDPFVDSCVFDGTNQSSEDGIYVGVAGAFVLASRVTNCAEGINSVSKLGVVGWSLFHGNSDDTSNDSLLYHLPFESDLDDGTRKDTFSQGNPAGSTNKFAPDTDDGYSDTSSQDYNLRNARVYNGNADDKQGMNVGS